VDDRDDDGLVPISRHTGVEWRRDDAGSLTLDKITVEYIEHECNAYCRPSEHLHCNLCWADGSERDALIALRNVYGSRFVDARQTHEAPTLAQFLSAGALGVVTLADVDDVRDVASFTQAYLVFYTTRPQPSHSIGRHMPRRFA
jgi:hypothetical protein